MRYLFAIVLLALVTVASATSNTITFQGQVIDSSQSTAQTTKIVQDKDGNYDVYSTVTGRFLAKFTTQKAAKTFVAQMNPQLSYTP